MVFIVLSPVVFDWFEIFVSAPAAANDKGRLAAAIAPAVVMMNWRREVEEFADRSAFGSDAGLVDFMLRS